MSFSGRRAYHDYVLAEVLPEEFEKVGMDFNRRGVERVIPKDGMIIAQLEDTGSQECRFTPDGAASKGETYLVELKTILPDQKSLNYDFEMEPWAKGMALHDGGALVAYVFWPAQKVAWISDAKPDWIGVPQWRWSKQDYLRVRHRYQSMCPVIHVDSSQKGSGTIFGVIQADRISAMDSFTRFWMQTTGKWLEPKQLRLH